MVMDLVDCLYDVEGYLIINYDNVKMSVLDFKLVG